MLLFYLYHVDTLAALERYFGYTQFRPGQREIVESLVNGKDVMAIMATGAGKSLTFQLPAILLPGVTIVVSPLIALMEDQVLHLRARGIPAMNLAHSLPSDESEYRLELLAQKQYKLVYVSPERLRDKHFQKLLTEITVSLVVVDEAHCISEWGHDFRPEYRLIAQFVQLLPTRPTIGAFTATARPITARDIAQSLGLRQPYVHLSTVVKPTLGLHVIPCQLFAEKWLHLVRLLRLATGSTLIYCTTHDETEFVWQLVTNLWHQGHLTSLDSAPLYYHAGLPNEVREQALKNYLGQHHVVMMATSAFGMGIDKPDIDLVIHWSLPATLESYVQQSGRAGRGGQPCTAYALFNPEDTTTQIELLPSDPIQSQRRLQMLEQLARYCFNTQVCRFVQVAQYFGEAAPACGVCDVCTQTVERHPFDQSPVSIEMKQRLDFWLRWRVDYERSDQLNTGWQVTDLQLLCASALECATIQDWESIPGCSQPYFEYAHHHFN